MTKARRTDFQYGNSSDYKSKSSQCYQTLKPTFPASKFHSVFHQKHFRFRMQIQIGLQRILIKSDVQYPNAPYGQKQSNVKTPSGWVITMQQLIDDGKEAIQFRLRKKGAPDHDVDDANEVHVVVAATVVDGGQVLVFVDHEFRRRVSLFLSTSSFFSFSKQFFDSPTSFSRHLVNVFSMVRQIQTPWESTNSRGPLTATA